jgi:hypothetical protein
MTSHLTSSDLRELRSMLTDLRCIQAAALGGAGVNVDKKAVEYMKQISRMVKLIDFELKDNLA